jgi:threonine dehydrogenase-like Zn-dependent dehydrogenase
MSKELTVFGSLRYAHVFPFVLDLMASGRVDVHSLVSAVHPYDETPEAMKAASSGHGVVKVQVTQE